MLGTCFFLPLIAFATPMMLSIGHVHARTNAFVLACYTAVWVASAHSMRVWLRGRGIRSASNKSSMLPTKRGTFVCRQEPFPAWWYTAHTLNSRRHLSLALWPILKFVSVAWSHSGSHHWAQQTLWSCLMRCSVIKSCKEEQERHCVCLFVFDCLLGAREDTRLHFD